MNKPVAWMNINVDVFNGKPTLSFDKDEFAEITTPLYTHQVKELTDEEILQVMINVYSDTVPPIRGVEFARAILRKAQEK